MKIIQSFWTGQQESTQSTFGWQTPEHHWLGWILSVNQLSKYYDVELYTDAVGYKYLIEALELPYTKVHVVLDELNHYQSNLWALSKIKTYSLQKESFLHVDGDVFIWEPFPENLLKQKLITQNLEVTTEYYQEMWSMIAPNLSYLPDEMLLYHNGEEQFACNMGIVGGTDLDFFQRYTKHSFEFVDKNRDNIPKDFMVNFNVFFEQVLFYLMAKQNNIQPSFLINEVSEDNGYKGFGDFFKVPHKKTYLHLLGHYKRDHKVCMMLKDYVLRYYPKYFQKLLQIDESYFPHYQKLRNYNFTSEENQQRIDAFATDTPSLSDPEFLLNRDLFSADHSREFDLLADRGEDVLLQKLPGWNIEDDFNQSEEFEKRIEIAEMFVTPTHIPIDDIDEMIFYQLQEPRRYSELLQNMIAQLDEDAQDFVPKFMLMIRDRVLYFITHKVLRFKRLNP
jgi:hypothetical protein